MSALNGAVEEEIAMLRQLIVQDQPRRLTLASAGQASGSQIACQNPNPLSQDLNQDQNDGNLELNNHDANQELNSAEQNVNEEPKHNVWKSESNEDKAFLNLKLKFNL